METLRTCALSLAGVGAGRPTAVQSSMGPEQFSVVLHSGGKDLVRKSMSLAQ